MNRNLDVLRSLAVAFVVVSHIPVRVPGLDSAFYDKMALGHLGVAIFFAHTTLVLIMSLERHGAAPLPFFVRRAFRIYPLAIAAVLTVVGLSWVAGVPTTGVELVSNLLLIQNLTGAKALPTPTWTLPFEVQMYLLLPALYVFAAARRSVGRALALQAAALALAIATGAWQSMTLVSFAPCFLSGLLAFTLPRRHFSPAWLWVLVALGAIAVPVSAAFAVPETPMLWVVCLALGFAIPRCRELRPGVVAQAGYTVATYSYGIYLTHVLAFALVFSSPQSTVGQWIAFLVLLPSFALVAYHGIERHGIAMGAALADRLRAQAPRPRAPAESALPLTAPARRQL